MKRLHTPTEDEVAKTAKRMAMLFNPGKPVTQAMIDAQKPMARDQLTLEFEEVEAKSK